MRCNLKHTWSLQTCLLAALLAGCTQPPGQHWGVVEAQLEASFVPPWYVLTPEGYLEAADGYGVDIQQLTLTVGELTVRQKREGTTSFDPANPPEGYSLCYNGHCHADDGTLVDYADIEADLNGGSVVGNSVSMTSNTTAQLLHQSLSFPLGACSNDCVLEYGQLDSVEVTITHLTVDATIYDVSGEGRLPSEGLKIGVELSTNEALTQALTGAADKETPLVVELKVELPLTTKLFDDINWPELLDQRVEGEVELLEGSEAGTKLLQNLTEHTVLEVEVTRHDP